MSATLTKPVKEITLSAQIYMAVLQEDNGRNELTGNILKDQSKHNGNFKNENKTTAVVQRKHAFTSIIKVAK